MLTKEDLANIKLLLDEQITGIKGEITGIKGEITGLKGEIAEIKENMVTKEEFNGLKQVVYEWKDYSHNKFVMLENEVIPKISALYEMTDFYVKQMECKKHREQADKKLDCIEPLKAVVKAHGEQLTRHGDMLEQLAGMG